MGDLAVSYDAPELDLGGGAAEDEGFEAEGKTGGEGETVGGEGEAEGEGEQQKAGPFRAIEDGRPSKAVKDILAKIENPAAAKAFQRALFVEDRLRRELPGGFKELETLRGHVEQLGGDTGIQEMQGELTGWRQFDEQWSAGDPKVLEFLTETPEAKDAFARIAPAAFEKYREMNFEGYQGYVSQVFSADMQQEEIPLSLRLLVNVLQRAKFDVEADRTEAGGLVNKLIGYVNRIGEFAKKDVALPTRATPDSRAAELDTREQKLRRTEWSGEVNKQHAGIFSEAWRRLVAPMLPADKAKAEAASNLIRRLYGIHLNEKLGAKRDFNPNMERFFKANQKDGFIRLHGSAFKEAVPLALRLALAEAGLTKRQAPNGNGKPAAAAASRAAAPAEDFMHVGKKPEMAEVNRNLTGTKMWLEHKAILKSGKKVTWD